MGFFDKNESVLGKKRKESITYRQGLRLKAARINKHLSLEEVTEELDLPSTDVLLQIEIGEFEGLENEVAKIVKFLSVSLID